VILLRFDDHEVMTEFDLTFEDNYPVIITAKDAVKFTKTDLDHVWVLEVDVTLPEPFVNDVLSSVGLPQTQSF